MRANQEWTIMPAMVKAVMMASANSGLGRIPHIGVGRGHDDAVIGISPCRRCIPRRAPRMSPKRPAAPATAFETERVFRAQRKREAGLSRRPRDLGGEVGKRD